MTNQQAAGGGEHTPAPTPTTSTNTSDKEDENNHKNGNSDNHSADRQETKLTATEINVIEMLKRQNLQVSSSAVTTSTPGDIVSRTLSDGTAITEMNNTLVKKHAFWDTQPMPHGEREQHVEGPIQPNRSREEIRQDPYTMPAGFMWCDVNIHNESERTELYTLLTNNYVEDDDALFRFDYSANFLLWALTPPGYRDEFLFGVRSTSSKKLVAFISGIPAKIQVYSHEIDVVEINFLCVHKKLRSKRLAPVLIKEITRRVNLIGIFQAVYTAGTVLPVPVASSRYYHRSLNPKKLVKVGFSKLGHRMTVARMQKLYKLPDKPLTPGLRPMEPGDVDQVHKLFIKYLQKFTLKVLFSKEEIAHWLLPREGVINSYVVEQNGQVTDFLSFYHLPSSILHHDDKLFAAYSYYSAATSMDIIDLMKDALILAKEKGCDVFNALNLMDNQRIMEPLKFGIGDGKLQYYIFNWACPEMPPEHVGLVLL